MVGVMSKSGANCRDLFAETVVETRCKRVE